MADKNSNVLGDVLGDLIKAQLSNPDFQKTILSALTAALGGLLGKLFGKKDVPVVRPGDTPVLSPKQADSDFPDDVIGAPKNTASRLVTQVKLGISRVQLSKERFPERVRADGTGYVYNSSEMDQVRKGAAIPFASKVWLDLTAYDQFGKEFLKDAVLANDLAFKTAHRSAEGAFIEGLGADDNGKPLPGYKTNDTDAIGNGISAWLASLGFLHQIKVHGEGTFTFSGEVGGVASNNVTLNVS